MGKKYTKDVTLEKLKEKSQNMNKFYSLGIVNWTGKTPLYDTKHKPEYYSEIISDFFLKKHENAESLGKKITKLIREKSYDSDESNCKTAAAATQKRMEEKIAKTFLESSRANENVPGKDYGEIGRFIKHQMALKDYRTNKNIRAGKVDLVSYNDKTDTVYLLELKRPDSTESLLRAGLEAFTYLHQLNHEKFCDDFYARLTNQELFHGKRIFSRVPTFGKTKFVAAILVYKNNPKAKDNQGTQYKNYFKEARTKTIEFLNALKVQCFFIDENNNIINAKSIKD